MCPSRSSDGRCRSIAPEVIGKWQRKCRLRQQREGPGAAEQGAARVFVSTDGENGGIHSVGLFRTVRQACREEMSERPAPTRRGLDRALSITQPADLASFHRRVATLDPVPESTLHVLWPSYRAVYSTGVPALSFNLRVAGFTASSSFSWLESSGRGQPARPLAGSVCSTVQSTLQSAFGSTADETGENSWIHQSIHSSCTMMR